MDIPAISCPSYNANVEYANHVFFECDIATDMWKLVFRWCDIPLFQASSWDSFNDWIISWNASKEKKHRFYVITTSVLWWLWRYRNSVTFNSQPLRKSDLFDNVRFSSFSWLHNRDHMKLSLNDWLMYPLSIMRNGNGYSCFWFFPEAGIQVRCVGVPVRQAFHEALLEEEQFLKRKKKVEWLRLMLENQVMEANLAPRPTVQVNKIASSCEICGGPHDTQYFMENPEQTFVDYASSRTDEAGDARLYKFKADFKQQQSKMTNKIDTFLKAINDRMTRALPSDTVKNPKLNVNPTYAVSLKDSKPFDTLADLGSDVNLIPLYLFKTLNIRTLEETENVLGLADGTKSYAVGIVKKRRDVPSTSDRRLIELKNQVQHLMEAYLAHKSPVQVNKIASSWEICIGPHDTQCCMENPGQAFVDYASSCNNEVGNFEMDDLTSEAHDLLSSMVILSEDNYRRGCERASDLESKFFMDVDNLGPPYKEEIEGINLDASFEANGSRTSEGGVT
ncbi:hypothetical protein Tco_0351569 [Tanacetum coccineum]